jgi:hypothetical protein
MANQQLFPQTTYPLTGDIQSTPGAAKITVTGIQTIPVSPTTPTDQQVLVFQQSLLKYVPSSVFTNKSVQVNGAPVSDDYDFFVNFYDTRIQVNSTNPPNGKFVLVNGA